MLLFFEDHILGLGFSEVPVEDPCPGAARRSPLGGCPARPVTRTEVNVISE